MTKEKIIETVNAHVQYNANQGTWSIDNRFSDELLKLLEQEEEEIFKDTLVKLIKFFNFNQNGTEASYSMSEIEDVIREFAEINGVEL